MGAAALIPIALEFLKNPQIQGLLGKFPLLGQLLPVIQGQAPAIQDALKPATVEEQIVSALTTLLHHMPTDAQKSSAYIASLTKVLVGAAELRVNL